MERYKFTYDIDDHVKGDTFPGVQFDLSDCQRLGEDLDLTGATAIMKLRAMSPEGDVVDTLSSESGGGLTIDEANTTITIDEQVIDIPATFYHYSIKVTLSGGEVVTYIGGIWRIYSNPS